MTSAKASSSANVGSKKPAATLRTCPGPQPKPALLPAFAPVLKSRVAPRDRKINSIGLPPSDRAHPGPAIEQVRFATGRVVNPVETPGPAGTEQRVRFVAVAGGNQLVKLAATSNPSGIPDGASFADRLRSQPDDVKKAFLSGTIQAILDYQRDTRYEPVDPQKPAPKKPNKVPDEVPGERSCYNKCNECDDEDGAYTECEHIDDGPFDTSLNPGRVGERAKPVVANKPVLAKKPALVKKPVPAQKPVLVSKPVPVSKPIRVDISQVDPRFYIDNSRFEIMLSGRNISALLSENVDKNASKYLFVVPFFIASTLLVLPLPAF